MNKNKIIARINPLFLKGIAHRGLHDNNITENSPSAFVNALNNHIAIEFDVHLSKDNHLIICHDSSLKRTTNKEGIIEELSLNEIKNNYRLLNGEQIPTLQEVLSLTKEKVPLLIELKPRKHNYRLLAKKVLEELKNIKDTKNFIIISFYPQCLLPIKNHFVRLLLVGTNKYPYLFRHFFEGVDLDVNLFKDKKFQKSKKHRLTFSWTIDTLEKINLAKIYSDALTFEKINFELLK